MIKPVAIATVKATQERFYIYNIASYTTENTVYALWVNCAGKVVSCSCPDHTFRHRQCKHMIDLQTKIDACKARKAAQKAAVVEAEKIIAETPAPVAEVVQETPSLMGLGRWGGNALYVSDKETKAHAAMIEAAEQKAAEIATKKNAKSATIKRAPQFSGFPLNDTRGFSLLKPTF